MKSLFFIVSLLAVKTAVYGQHKFEITSPRKNIVAKILIGDSINFSVWSDNKLILASSGIGLVTDKNGMLGARPRIAKSKIQQEKRIIENEIPYKRRFIPDEYTELVLRFRDEFTLKFRAYDDGVAYRFELTKKDSITIINEIVNFKLSEKPILYWPEVNKRDDADEFHSSFEAPYSIFSLTELSEKSIAFSPILADFNHTKILLTESDLLNYPGMFFRKGKEQSLIGAFAQYPKSEKVVGGEFKQWIVTERYNYIAKVKGTQQLPWRVIGIARNDRELLMNDLVYRLASPPAPIDWSWVKPGMSTEEWICGINLYDVDFKAGLNTESYKYYIDFAHDTGLTYVMLDAGWSDPNDLFKITPGLDLEEIAAYAKSKKINLILWTLAMTLDRQLDEGIAMFKRLGVKAILTDFMDRDDQKTVNFYQRVAEATAKNKIMVMYHGAFKGAGFERTYPNAITREAVLGSEYNVWSDLASPEHDLLLPFIRMASGPMDYEPGFMKNVNQKTFRALPDMPMSQGTRAHQAAMFVVYESPMQMFSGNPSDAWKEKSFMQFLSSIPTMWDETIILDAKLGDYVLLARRNNNDWYLGAMTDWTARELEVDFSFLTGAIYKITTVEDGINVVKNSSDYMMNSNTIKKGDRFKINLGPGGGYVAKLTPQ